MSYCRFQNTATDFADCLSTLREARNFSEMGLSEYESRAMLRLASYARQYLERYTELQEQEEYEFARNMDDGA
jgi:hypothetical protein